MELTVVRSYFDEGTQGALYIDRRFCCFVIEPKPTDTGTLGCIPEGFYTLKPRYCKRYHHHLMVCGVSGFGLVLISDSTEVQAHYPGSLLPLARLTDIARGWGAHVAMQKLLAYCHQGFERSEPVVLTLKNNAHAF